MKKASTNKQKKSWMDVNVRVAFNIFKKVVNKIAEAIVDKTK